MDFSKYGKIEMDYIEASRELERLDVVRNNCKSNICEIIAAVQSLASLVDYQCNINEYEVVNKGLDYNVDQIAIRLSSQIDGYKNLALLIGSDISELNNVVQEVTSNNTKDYQNYMKRAKFGVTDTVYYNQFDYNDVPYRYNNDPKDPEYTTTIGNSGCGPTCAAIVLSTFLDEEITPITMCEYSISQGDLGVGGTYVKFFDDVLNEYNMDYKKQEQTSSNIIESLEAGNYIIASMGNGTFTNGNGHYIVLTGIDEKGNIIVADPASRPRTATTWQVNIFEEQAKGHKMYVVSP